MKESTMVALGKVMAFILVAAFVIACVLCIYGIMWWVWSQAVPAVWPSGPPTVIRPNFWPFAGCMFLVTWIGRLIFGRRDKSK